MSIEREHDAVFGVVRVGLRGRISFLQLSEEVVLLGVVSLLGLLLEPRGELDIAAGPQEFVDLFLDEHVGLAEDLVLQDLEMALALRTSFQLVDAFQTNNFVKLIVRVDLLVKRLWAVDRVHVIVPFLLNNWPNLFVLPIPLLQPQQMVECHLEGNHDLSVQFLVHQHG